MDDKSIQKSVLEALASDLDAQARAVRRLIPANGSLPSSRRVDEDQARMSQVDIVEDILRRAGSELHITDIIERAKKAHRVSLDRESVVSALTKKITRGERFERRGPNVFALKGAK